MSELTALQDALIAIRWPFLAAMAIIWGGFWAVIFVIDTIEVIAARKVRRPWWVNDAEPRDRKVEPR